MEARHQIVLAIYATWGATFVYTFAKETAKAAVKNQTSKKASPRKLNEVPTRVLRAELEKRDTNTEFLKIMHDNEIN